jgi:hypothetical protein
MHNCNWLAGLKMNLGLPRRVRRRRATSSQSFCTILMVITSSRLCMNATIRPVAAKMRPSQEESMSEDSASKSDHTKSRQDSASGEAKGTRGGVHFAASPSV